MTKKQYERRGFLYVLPLLIGFIAFHLIPIGSSIALAFSDLKLLNKPHFVGLANFTTMFTKDDLFYHALKVTFVYTAVSVPAKVAFALVVAMLLNLKVRGVAVFRLIYYMPSILGGSVVISVLWRFLFMRDGLLNQIVSTLTGAGPIDWLGPNLALATLSLLQVWQFGSSMVLFLAALKGVPRELYEASMVDGAGRLRMFLSVTIPMITPIIFFNVVMQTINALQHFTEFFVVTGGGPLHATYVFGVKIWEEAFRFIKMGYAAALSWVLVAIIVLFTAIIFVTSKYWVFTEDKKIL
jgi:oligogalacturonide transport system permease protein